MDNNQFYAPHLEWEFSDFPIKLIQLDFEKSNWGFNQDSFIEIHRNKNHELSVKIFGNVSYPEKLKDDDYVDKGNIIEGQKITALDAFGHFVTLKGCHLIHIQSNSTSIDRNSFIVEGELSIDEFHITFKNMDEINLSKTIRLDWFTCHDIPARFSGITFRNPKLVKRKIRKGIDEYNDSMKNFTGSSSSKDYVLVKLPNFEFILSRVPEVFLPYNKQGICFEFRNSMEYVTDDMIVGIKSFVAFLLGNTLHYKGYSIIKDERLIQSCLYQKDMSYENKSMPPIKFNSRYDWGDIGVLLNQYLPKYLELRKSLKLDEVLSRYWIATNLPLGTNLPILSSALETLAQSYLKTLKDISLEYIEKNEYLKLLQDELSQITIKLTSIEGSEIMINKIANVFRKGVNEKVLLFYKVIGINIGKCEKKALGLRNKMAHGVSNYSKSNKIYDDVVLSRVYEVLFNKTILVLLDYKEYYIDYSIKGCPIKHISIPVGEN